MKNRPLQSSNSAAVVRKILIAFFKQFTANNPKKQGNQQDTNNSGEREIHVSQDNRMYRVNLGLVLITLVIALVSIYQGWLNRRQLTIATTPYLQITNIRPTIEYGKAAKITFEIDNLTKIPTKIIGANLGDSVSGQRRSISNSIKTYNPYSTELRASDQVNRYDIEGSPYEDTYIAGYILDGHAYSDLTSNSGDQAFLYFYGTINYVNQVNNDERAYQFEVKITLCPAYRLETVTNANYSTD